MGLQNNVLTSTIPIDTGNTSKLDKLFNVNGIFIWWVLHSIWSFVCIFYQYVMKTNSVQ